MQRSRTIVRNGSRVAILLFGTLVTQFVIGCAGTGGRHKPAIETRTENGFTITEANRPRMGSRSDFDNAVEALATGDTERAIELLKQVTESDPTFAAPHINLGIAYREAGKLEEAKASLERALEANPRHPVAHNELGIVYRHLGKFEDARTSYETSLALQKDFHFARKNLGIVCDLFLEDLACALQNYELYHAAVPDDEEVAMWIADLSQRTGR